MPEHILDKESFLQRKKDLREIQKELSLKEKMEMLDRMQLHFISVLKNPLKKIK